jgi:flavin reductase (DIM6/NTAB) family NADH-FMN oxidoreductase RutF
MPSPDITAAYAAWAGAVTLVTIADGRDDIGATVSAFCPVSVDPPLVLVSLIADSYPAEVLARPDAGGSAGSRGGDPPHPPFAVTLLSAAQRMLAGRFAAEGRPGARLMLDDVPHSRGAASGALIPDGGLAALECEAEQRIEAGDHLLIVARVTAVPYATDDGSPLIRFRSRYAAYPNPAATQGPR